jgi:hypothetical protein
MVCTVRSSHSTSTNEDAMKTTKDARRVVELSNQRDALNKLAGEIRMADDIAAGYQPERDNRLGGYPLPARLFRFAHLADELRELVKREAAAQIEAIDSELKVLGVTPDEFEAAKPDAA